ncbi:hypothetical protein RRG08_029065 [Elysia crispata]|uniref:Uncharacterized protein n=1 Tax=Elysia crispata TaxID=231223 RepID=A0AAE0ZKG1_9GAST|nr:hypothetical protein RRG08_029065 [Elysia crispata]
MDFPASYQDVWVTDYDQGQGQRPNPVCRPLVEQRPPGETSRGHARCRAGFYHPRVQIALDFRSLGCVEPAGTTDTNALQTIPVTAV